jgi:hypothetical protein
VRSRILHTVIFISQEFRKMEGENERTLGGEIGRMVERFIELRGIINAHLQERAKLQEQLTAMGIRLAGMARVRNKASAPIKRRRSRNTATAPESDGVAVETAE